MSIFTRFDTDVDLRYERRASEVLGSDHWSVLTPFSYYLDDDKKKWVLIPKFFITDVTSVPRTLWSFIPKHGKHGQAAVVHDFLRRYGLIHRYDETTHEFVQDTVTRKEADRIFYEALLVLGVNKIQAKLMWGAVSINRVFTSGDWGKYELDVEMLERELRENDLIGNL